MSQQYGYGYGYQAYGYGHPVPVPQAAAPFMGYATPTRMPYTAVAQPPQPTAAPQQPSVGYSPYPSNPPPPAPGVLPAATSQVSRSLPQTPSQDSPQTPQASYYNYPSYKPQTPAYTPYYSGMSQAKTMQTTTPTSATSKTPPAAPTVNSYTSTPPPNASSGVVSYPAYTQSTYASAANAYYKHMKENKISPMGPVVGYQPQYPATTTQQAAANLTPVQQQVVQQYIHQKTQAVGQNFARKKVYTPPQNPQTYYCEVCKISAASALTYKTHLEGKNHKKKLAQQKVSANQNKTNSAFYCELCDVMCSNKDGLEAHIRGSKHTKVMNLHKRMGKPIPAPKVTGNGGTGSQKTVMVTAPRISFVGGKQLSSTGSGGFQESEIKVYPPQDISATTPTVTSTPTPTTTNIKVDDASEEPNATTTSEPEPEPVGEHLVVMVKGDPKFPHATYKCDMCDCYFNDEFAKKAHVKGRRHRLNYKKMYQPSLYVEPTKSMKKEIEKKKKHRQLIMEMKKASAANSFGRGRGRGGGWGGHGNYFNNGGNYGDYGLEIGNWNSPDPGMSPNEIHRQETLELARMRQREEMYEEFYPPGTIGPPPMSYQPRNPHDDKLVLNKHSSIYPDETELAAVDGVVSDVEKVLKNISDDLLESECKSTEGSVEGNGPVQKDESKRELKGVMRVGAFARGLLLRGECSVELVLMTTNKPVSNLFHTLAGRIPAKFEELNKSANIKNIYNVTPKFEKSAFIIISQVDDYCIQVTVTMTSTSMREEPTPEQAMADEEEGVLDRPSCLAALAALRHTKWFQAMAYNLPSCVIIMRVLKDICRRVPAWGVLDTWILQLLVQKCIVSANSDFTKPGDVFRRVIECVAAGLFLPGGTGLYDPCEKGVVDASASLTAQERANITLSAQHALRLIAFDKLHLVLGVDPIPLPGEEGEAAEEKESEEGSGGTKRDADTSEEPEGKKIKLDE